MATDPRRDGDKGISASPGGVAIALDQTYDPPFRALYVGTTGDVKVDCFDGSTLTLVGMAGGMIHAGLLVKKVYATGTSADNLIGLL